MDSLWYSEHSPSSSPVTSPCYIHPRFWSWDGPNWPSLKEAGWWSCSPNILQRHLGKNKTKQKKQHLIHMLLLLRLIYSREWKCQIWSHLRESHLKFAIKLIWICTLMFPICYCTRFRCCVHSLHHIFTSLLKRFFFFNLNKTFLQRILGELLSAFWFSLEVMVWDPPLCSHTVGMNEHTSRSVEPPPPLPFPWLRHMLSHFLCVPTNMTRKNQKPYCL